MMKLSERLSLLENLISCAHDIIFTQFNTDYEVIYSSMDDINLISLFFSLDNIQTIQDLSSVSERLHISEIKYRPIPHISTNSLGMIWISEPLIEDNVCQGILIIGPVFASDYSMQNISNRMDKLQVPVLQKQNFMTFAQTLPVISMTTMCQYGTMLHFSIYEEKIDISDLLYADTISIKNDLQEDYVFAPEKLRDLTQTLLTAVESGNINYNSIWREYRSLTDISPAFIADALRTFKNQAIILTSECANAAMRGGLSPSVSYILLNNYMSAIEASKNITEASECRDTMLNDFISRVRKIKSSAMISPQIRSICDQIELQPEEEYDLSLLAASIGYSEYYFTKKFKAETGITIKEYILEQKMKRAQQLLKTTTYSIQEIAELLNFSSQSYFTKCFRKTYGFAPREMR